MINYSIGDSVKITPFYLIQYPVWAEKIKDKPAKVVSVKSWKVKMENIPKDDRAMYRTLYGNLPEYDLFELMIEIEGTKYMSSQFGFAKA